MSIRTVLVAAALLLLAPFAAADKDEIYTGLFSDLAVQGYDTVAYFTAGGATKGSAEFTADYKGAEWRFASQSNRDAFLANPEQYAPQYGGYCAWAVAQGYTAKGDANHWKVVDGRLYLNYNAKVKKDWEVDIPGFIQSGDANWPTVLE